jgi:hypothetical protein
MLEEPPLFCHKTLEFLLNTLSIENKFINELCHVNLNKVHFVLDCDSKKHSCNITLFAPSLKEIQEAEAKLKIIYNNIAYEKNKQWFWQ